MNASQESNEFVEPAPRPPTSGPSAVASTSRVALSSTAVAVPETSIEHPADGTTPDSPSNAGDDHNKPMPATQPAPSAASKARTFIKSSSPDVQLRIYLPRELDHTLTKKLKIIISTHGGVMESRLGKADMIVVDPKLMTAARKLLKQANELGQPIPVVTLDYLYDCASQCAQLDVHDPKYKFQPTPPSSERANLPAPAPRSLNGRNAFTDADRQAIISYFVDKDEASWSLNAAARELAACIPTHPHTSFQSYLQNNFDKGWNLRREIRAARRDALGGDPSQLQARILRSQYTPEPLPSEESAPSDGWPHASSPPAAGAQAQIDHEQGRASHHSSQQDEDEPDLQVRKPNPGVTIDNVERSPTKIKQPVEYASSVVSSPGTTPPPSVSLAGRALVSGVRASSDDEESDPDEYSPKMMMELLRTQTPSRSGPPQKSRPKPRQTESSSSSSDDSELDQLNQDDDKDLIETAPPKDNPARADRSRAEQSEDPEWEGSRRLERRMGLGTSQGKRADVRVKFTQDEKNALLNTLVDHVLAKGSHLPPATQDAIIAKPEDSFWEQFAVVHSKHSAASWRSHYLKNRPVYKEMIDLMILDRVAGQAEDDSDDDEEGSTSYDGSLGEGEDGLAAEQQRDEHLSTADETGSSRVVSAPAEDIPKKLAAKTNGSFRAEDTGAPSDGVVVWMPPLVAKPLSERRSPSSEEWPETPPPPPMHDVDEEEEDMMQVEAEIDASVVYSAPSQEESPDGPVADKGDSLDADPEALEQVANEESAGSSSRPSLEAPRRSQRNTAHVEHRRSSSMVQAGTPVLAQHRDAPFYDFTMDSDEEQRIRKARSRPSLPNLQSHQDGASPKVQKSRITADRVLGHFATPSRSQKPAATRQVLSVGRRNEDDRFQRTREWARSVSRTPPSGSSDALPSMAVAITESSRSRASRILRGPVLRSPFAAEETPSRQHDRPQSLRHISRGRDSGALAPVSPTPVRARAKVVDALSEQNAARSAQHAARMRYRASVVQFREEFGVDSRLGATLLMRFGGYVDDARDGIRAWLNEIYEAYGVEADVAFEYVKTSQGDFDQAETFLRLAAMTRSGSTSNRSSGNVSRAATYSTSPRKRSGIADERSFTRPEASKRFRS
ncbi:hypothetical protein EX895_002242 [Sporisorium graminicola]|uniref:BRCT domain-containing protein n=1 Tax=Sporisorium graminicola TaxID=280036 RepID=A0A4U7KWC9_9BASI|nr:hypothetical protein EX895_002242 [Sporisorium graminicola]TKY89001.1 hypothetical protein EX895_002242 [Sporisorium graminicola]